VQSVIEMVKIPWGGSIYPTFGAWLHAEVVKMSGSIFKMISIYPKLIFVFLLYAIVRA
jgi:hypothetical protein